MTTALDKSIRRELSIEGRPYTLTLTDAGLKLVEKRRRRGIELHWRDLVNGDAQLAAALSAATAPPPRRRHAEDQRPRT